MSARTQRRQCAAWTTFFLDVLAVQEITALNNYVIINPKVGGGTSLVIAEWGFTGAGTSGVAGFPYRNTLLTPKLPNSYEKKQANGTWIYEWGATEEVKDKPGIKGQGTDNPRAMFTGHIVAQIGGKIYDPSYGLKFNTLQDLEDTEVVGFGDLDYLVIDPANSTNNTYIWRFKKNPAGEDVVVRTKTYKDGKIT